MKSKDVNVTILQSKMYYFTYIKIKTTRDSSGKAILKHDSGGSFCLSAKSELEANHAAANKINKMNLENTIPNLTYALK